MTDELVKSGLEVPFSWQLRMSKRAKRPRITLDKHGVVELVWPENMSTHTAPKMIQEHTPWVLRHLARQPQCQVENFPPLKLEMLATAQCWQVCYAESAHPLRLVEQDNMALLLTGRVGDLEQVRLLLCAWLKKQGKAVLSPILSQLADDMGESYASVSIRLQKRRWGSCSVARRINLNASLLFLPRVLLRHVLIHELAHLQQHNHSARFWAVVEQYDPDYQQHRAQLRAQSHLVPQWLTDPI